MQHINHLNGILPTEHIPLHAVDVKAGASFIAIYRPEPVSADGCPARA